MAGYMRKVVLSEFAKFCNKNRVCLAWSVAYWQPLRSKPFVVDVGFEKGLRYGVSSVLLARTYSTKKNPL